VRRIRALGGQTDNEDPTVVSRERAPLPAAPSREEEAILIAERLAALVESRRAEASAGATATTGSPAVAAAVVGARHSGRLLGNLLLTRGFLVESELQFALAKQASTGEPIGQILVDLGLITDRDLVELLAEQLRMHVIDLTRVERDRSTLALLPKATARRLAAIPLRRIDGQLDVALADPTDAEAIEELTRLLGSSLRLFLASRAEIDAAVDRLYD
jgi:hypothetical protein